MGGCEAGTLVPVEPSVRYHPGCSEALTQIGESLSGTVPGGQFGWGGRLLKGNGGALRSPQADWKPAVECKRRRGLDCEADEPSRGESRG